MELCFSLSFRNRDEAVHLHLAISHYNNTFGSLFLETSSNIWANFSFSANNENDNDNGYFLKRLLLGSTEHFTVFMVTQTYSLSLSVYCSPLLSPSIPPPPPPVRTSPQKGCLRFDSSASFSVSWIFVKCILYSL